MCCGKKTGCDTVDTTEMHHRNVFQNRHLQRGKKHAAFNFKLQIRIRFQAHSKKKKKKNRDSTFIMTPVVKTVCFFVHVFGSESA